MISKKLIKHFLNLVQLIFVAAVLSGCMGGEGNAELTSGSLGLELSIEEGGDQVLEDPLSVSEEITLKLQNSEGSPSQNSTITFELLNPESGAKLIAQDAVTDSNGEVRVSIVGADDFGKIANVLATVSGTTITKEITVAIRDKIVPTKIEIVDPPTSVVANQPYTITLRLVDDSGRVAEDPVFNTEATLVFNSISGNLTSSSFFNKISSLDRVVKFENGVGYLTNIQYKYAETINLTLSDHGKIPDLEVITGKKVDLSEAKSMLIVPDAPVRMQLKDPSDATTDDTVILEAEVYDQFDNFAYNYTNLCSINVALVGDVENNPWIIDAGNLSGRDQNAIREFSDGSATFSVRDSSVENVTASVTTISQGCGGIVDLGTPVTFNFSVGALAKLVYREPSPSQAKTTEDLKLTIVSTDSFGNFNSLYNGTVKVVFDDNCNAEINPTDHSSQIVTLADGTREIGIYNRNLNRNSSVTCTASLEETGSSDELDLSSNETLTFIPGDAAQLGFSDISYEGQVGWGTNTTQRNPATIDVEVLDYYNNPIFSYAGGTAEIVSDGTTEISSSAKSIVLNSSGKGSVTVYSEKSETVNLSFSNAPSGIRYSVGNTENLSLGNIGNLTASLYFKWGIANYIEMEQPVSGNVDDPITVTLKAYDYGNNLVEDYGTTLSPMSDLEIEANSTNVTVASVVNFVSGVANVDLSNTKEEVVDLSLKLQSGVTLFQNSQGQNIDYTDNIKTKKSTYFKWGDANRKFVISGDNDLNVDDRAQIKVQVLDQYDNPVRDFGCDAITADLKLVVDGGARFSASSTFDHTNLATYNALNSLEDLDISIQSGGCSILASNPSGDLTSDASFGYLFLYNRSITPEGSVSKSINVTLSDINSKGYSIVPSGGYQVVFKPGALSKFTVDAVGGTVDAAINVGFQAKDQFDNHIVNYIANDAAVFRWIDQKDANVLFNGVDNRANNDLYLDFEEGNNGKAFISLIDETAETVVVGLENITGIDTSSSASITFAPGEVKEIRLYAPSDLSSITTDDKSLFTLRTLDQYGNHNITYDEDVKISINKNAGIVTNASETNSDNYVTISEKVIDIDNGIGTFYAFDKVSEVVTFSLIDENARDLSLNPLDVTFNHGVAVKALLTRLNGSVIDADNLSAEVSADSSAIAEVSVTDKYNNIAISYNDDFSLNIDSGDAELRTSAPTSSSLPDTSVNQVRSVDIISGVGQIYILARKQGSVRLSVSDSEGSGFTLFPENGSETVVLNVNPGDPTKYGVIISGDMPVVGGNFNGLPTALGQGNSEDFFDITVNAYDAYNNLAVDHTGDVYFQLNKNAKISSVSLPIGSNSIGDNAASLSMINGSASFQIYDRTAEEGVNILLSSSSGTNTDGLNTDHQRVVNFSFGKPNYFAIIKPSNSNSVESSSVVKIEVRDQYHNIIESGFEGSVDFNVNGDAFLNDAAEIDAVTGFPSSKEVSKSVSFTSGNTGFALINVYDRKAEVVTYSLSNGLETAPGSGTLDVGDKELPTEIKTQEFTPGSVSNFLFTTPATIDGAGNHVTADNSLELEVKAYDKYSNFADNYTSEDVLEVSVSNGGDVVSSDDGTTVITSARISFGGTFSQGISKFHVRNTLSGVTNVALVDYNTDGYTLDNVDIKVSAGEAVKFEITDYEGVNNTGTNAALNPVADNPVAIYVTAFDNYNNIVLSFAGAVDFEVISGSEGHSWVGGTSLNTFSNGVGIKQFNKTKVGNITIGLTTPVNPSSMDISNANATTTIYVDHGSPSKYAFNDSTGPFIAGEDILVDIEARDIHDNRVVTYSGTGKNVQVQYQSSTGTFKDGSLYVSGPITANFNSGLTSITIRKQTFDTSFPTVGETLTLGLVTGDDATMNTDSTASFNFGPADVNRLSVVVDSSDNGGAESPYSIDSEITARLEARDSFGNYNNTFSGSFDITVDKNAWVFQEGLDFDNQDETIKAANVNISSGYANFKVANLSSEVNVSLTPSNSDLSITTYEKALIDFMHGVGVEYELVFTDTPLAATPTFSTDKLVPILINVIDKGGNRVLDHPSHDVGLTSVVGSSNTFENVTGVNGATPYVTVENGQSGFSYQGRLAGNFTIDVSASLKDSTLSKENTARPITVLPGTVSELSLSLVSSVTADDLLVSDLGYSQGVCPAYEPGSATCPKPMKLMQVLPKDQYGNINNIEGSSKVYDATLVATSTLSNIERWSQAVKIIEGQTYLEDGVTLFNRQVPRAEDVEFSISNISPATQFDENSNTVTIDYSSTEERTILPGIPRKVWIVQPADNTIDNPINVTVQIQDGQNIDGNGNGNLISTADPRALKFKLDSAHPSFTGLGPSNVNDGDVNDLLDGFTITIRGGVGVYQLESLIAEDVEISLESATSGFANRFDDGDDGLYFDVLNMEKTITFSPGAPTEYKITPKPANASLFDSSEDDDLNRFEFPVKIFDRGGNEKTDVSGKVTVQASITDGTVTLYNSDESVSSTSGQLTVDVINGLANVKFTTTKAGIVNLSLLQAAGDTLSLDADSTNHQVSVLSGPTSKLALQDPLDIKTTDVIDMSLVGEDSSMNITSVLVRALDVFDNFVDTFSSKSISLNSDSSTLEILDNDTEASSSIAVFSNGQAFFKVRNKKAEVVNLTLIDSTNSLSGIDVTGTQAQVDMEFFSGPVAQYSLEIPSKYTSVSTTDATVDAAIGLQVFARDIYENHNTITSEATYDDDVVMSLSLVTGAQGDFADTPNLDSNYAVDIIDGVGTFDVRLRKFAPSRYDGALATYLGLMSGIGEMTIQMISSPTSKTFVANKNNLRIFFKNGSAAHLTMNDPDPLIDKTTDDTVSLNLFARDQFGNLDINYSSGTVEVSSTGTASLVGGSTGSFSNGIAVKDITNTKAEEVTLTMSSGTGIGVSSLPPSLISDGYSQTQSLVFNPGNPISYLFTDKQKSSTTTISSSNVGPITQNSSSELITVDDSVVLYLYAVDAGGNINTSVNTSDAYSVNANLSATIDSSNASYGNFTNGEGFIVLSHTKNETIRLTIIPQNLAISVNSLDVTFDHGVATGFEWSVPVGTTIDQVASVSLQAKDQYDNNNVKYDGTLTLSGGPASGEASITQEPYISSIASDFDPSDNSHLQQTGGYDFSLVDGVGTLNLKALRSTTFNLNIDSATASEDSGTFLYSSSSIQFYPGSPKYFEIYDILDSSYNVYTSLVNIDIKENTFNTLLTTDDVSTIGIQAIDNGGNRSTSYNQSAPVALTGSPSSNIDFKTTGSSGFSPQEISKSVNFSSGLGQLEMRSKLSGQFDLSLIAFSGSETEKGSGLKKITFEPGKFKQVTFPATNVSNVAADSSFSLSIESRDQYGNLTEYNGLVRVGLEVSPGEVKFPGDTGFPSDVVFPTTSNTPVTGSSRGVISIVNGIGTLAGFEGHTSGDTLKLVIVENDLDFDENSLIGVTSFNYSVTVTPGTPSAFSITPTLASYTIDDHAEFTVQAIDIYNNATPSYSGDVYIKSSNVNVYQPTSTSDNAGENGNVGDDSNTALKYNTSSGQAFSVTGGVFNFYVNSIYAQDDITFTVQSESTSTMAVGQVAEIDFTHGSVKFFKLIQPNIISSTFHGTIDDPVEVIVEARDRGKKQIVGNYNSSGILNLSLSGGSAASRDVYNENNAPAGLPGSGSTSTSNDFSSGIGKVYVRSKLDQNLTLTMSDLPAGTSIDGASSVSINFLHGEVDKLLFSGNTLSQTTDNSFDLQATVKDQYNNVADTFVGKFTIVALKGTFSHNGSEVTGGEEVSIPNLGLLEFEAADAGVSSVSTINVTSSGKLNGGSQIVRFGLQAHGDFDASDIDISDTEDINVENGVAFVYRVLPVTSSQVVAGVDQTLKVRLEDSSGNVVDNASSSGGFNLSLNSSGSIPSNTTLNNVVFSSQNTAVARSSNLNKGVIELSINSTKSQTITASIGVGGDSVAVNGATTSWEVIADACNTLAFSPETLATTSVDDAFDLVVEARDQYANPSSNCSASFQLSANSSGVLDFVSGKGVGDTLSFSSGQSELTIPVQNKVSGDTGVTRINFGIQGASSEITTSSSTRNIDYTYGAHKSYTFDLVQKAGNANYTIDEVIAFEIWAIDQFENRVLGANTTVNINSSLSNPFKSGTTSYFSSGVSYNISSGKSVVSVETLKAENLVLNIQSTGAGGVLTGQQASANVIHGSTTNLKILDVTLGNPVNPGNTDSKIKIEIEALDKGGNRVLSYNPGSSIGKLYTISVSGSDINETDLTTTSTFTTENIPYIQEINIQSFTSGISTFYVKSRTVAQFEMGLKDLSSGLTQTATNKIIEFVPGGTHQIKFGSSDTSTAADTNFLINLVAQDQFGNETPDFAGRVKIVDTGSGTSCSSLSTSETVFISGTATVTRSNLRCSTAGIVVLGIENATGTSVSDVSDTYNLTVTHGTTNLKLSLNSISDKEVSETELTTVLVRQQDEYGNLVNTMTGLSFNLTVSATDTANIRTSDDSGFPSSTRTFSIADNTGYVEIGLKSTVAQKVTATLSGITDSAYSKTPLSGRSFFFTAGSAAKLAFSQPSAMLKTTEEVDLEIQALDVFDNETIYNGNVTISASNNDSLVVGSTGTIPIVGGIGDLTIQRTSPTTSTVVFTMGGTSLDVSGQSFSLTVIAGDPYQIFFGAAPVGASVDDTSVNIDFTLADFYGNATTVSSGSVSANLKVTNGNAKFNSSGTNEISQFWSTSSSSEKSLSINDQVAETATISVISASYDGENLDLGTPLGVTFSHGTPTKLEYSLVPLNPKTDQSPQLKVELYDQYNNVATSVSNKSITLNLSQSSGIAGVYSGDGTKTLSSGVGTFTLASATRQVLNASITNSNGYTNPADEQINFIWGNPFSLDYELIPNAATGVKAGDSWNIKAAILDGKSNKLLEYSGSAKLELSWSGEALLDGSPSASPTFSSPQTTSFSSGVSEWTMTGEGAGSLTVTAVKTSGDGSPSSAGATFPIDGGAASKIIIGSPGSDGIVSLATEVQIYLQDNFGNAADYTGNITFDIREGQNVTDGRVTTNTGYHDLTGQPVSRSINFSNTDNTSFNMRAIDPGWVNVYSSNPPTGMSMQATSGMNFYFMPGEPVEYKIVAPPSPEQSLFHSSVSDSSIYHAASGVPQTLTIQAVDVSGSVSVNWGGCVNVSLGNNARPKVSTVCLTSGEGSLEFYDEFIETFPITLEDASSDNLNDGTSGKDCTVSNSCTLSLSVGKSRAKEITVSNVAASSNQSTLPTSLYSYAIIRSINSISTTKERITSTATVYDEFNNVFTNYKANYTTSGCWRALNNSRTFEITNGSGTLSCNDYYKRSRTINLDQDVDYSGSVPVTLNSEQFRSHNNTLTQFILFCDGDNIVSTDEQQSCFIRPTDSYGSGITGSGLQRNSVSEVEGLSVEFYLEDNDGNINASSTGYIDENNDLSLDAGDTMGTQGQPFVLDFSGSVNMSSSDSSHNADHIHKRFLVGNTEEEFVTVKINSTSYTGSIWTTSQISAINTSATQSIYFTPAETSDFEIASVTANVSDPAFATQDNSHFYTIEIQAKTSNGQIAVPEDGFLYLDASIAGVSSPVDLSKVKMKNGDSGSFSSTNSVLAEFVSGIAKVYVSSADQGNIKFTMRHAGSSSAGFINNNVEKSFAANSASKLSITTPASDSLYADLETYNVEVRALDDNDNLDSYFNESVSVTFIRQSVDQSSKITNLSSGKVTFTNGVGVLNIATELEGEYTLGVTYAGLTGDSQSLEFLLPVPDEILRDDTNTVTAGAIELSFRAQKNGVLASDFNGYYTITYNTSGGSEIVDGSIDAGSNLAITNGVGSLSIESSKAQSIDIVFTKVFTNGAEPVFSSVTGLSFSSGIADHLDISAGPSGEYEVGTLLDLSVSVKDSEGTIVSDAVMNLSLVAHSGSSCGGQDNTGFTYSSASTAVTSGSATFTNLNASSARTMSLQVIDTSSSPITSDCTETITTYQPLAMTVVDGNSALINEEKIVEISGGIGNISLSSFSSAVGSTASIVTSADASCATSYCIKYTAGNGATTDTFTIEDSASSVNQLSGSISVTASSFEFLDGDNANASISSPFDLGQFINTNSGTQTVTIKNNGNATSGTISTVVSEDVDSMWDIQNNYCEGVDLAIGDDCDIILAFDSQEAGATPDDYEMSITVNSANTPTAAVFILNAELLHPLEFSESEAGVSLGATLDKGSFDNSTSDSTFIVKVRHSNSSSSSSSNSVSISVVSQSDANFWNVDSSDCSGASLNNGDTCDVSITFKAATNSPSIGNHNIKLRASSSNTGQRDLTIEAQSVSP